MADLNDNHIISSPLASDSSRLETFPTFSPNGKYIYYCAANKKKLSVKNLKNLKYALVRIPFNEENGRFGERIDTLYSSRSVCHPKLSPDGRFCLFTVLDYGTFPAWHTESDLYMLDLQTGKTDSLNIVNSKKSDTYHCWSHTGNGLSSSVNGMMASTANLTSVISTGKARPTSHLYSHKRNRAFTTTV